MENNLAYYPSVAFYFSVVVNGEAMSFNEVSGISIEKGVEEIAEGGENRFAHRLPKSAKYQNLVLKRGFVADGSMIIKWCKATISDGLSSAISTKTITVKLLDEKAKPLVSWTFYDAYPIKYSVSDFRSQNNMLAIESMEFAYSYFERKDKVV